MLCLGGLDDSIGETHAKAVRSRRHWIVALLAAAAIAVSSPLLWWDDTGFDAWTVAFTFWQASPFALLLFLHSRLRLSDTGAVLVAVVVAGLTLLGYVAIHRDDSSTAALGFIWFPIWLAVLVAIAWLMDLGLRGMVTRFAKRSYY